MDRGAWWAKFIGSQELDMTEQLTHTMEYYSVIKKNAVDFPGGPVVKNRLPMQGTQFQSLVREDFTPLRAVHHSYGACALEPTSHNY